MTFSEPAHHFDIRVKRVSGVTSAEYVCISLAGAGIETDTRGEYHPAKKICLHLESRGGSTDLLWASSISEVDVPLDDAIQLIEFGFWNNSRGEISCRYVDFTFGSEFRVGSYCGAVLLGRRS